MVLPIETAQELAMIAALSEWHAVNGDGEIQLPLEYAREFQWGWIFEAATVGADGERYPGICVSVDRFSGKTQIIAGKAIANDDWPLLELQITSVGPDQYAVFQLIRELTGWNASYTLQMMRGLPFVVAVGPMMSIRPINQALLARHAATSIVRRRA